MSVNALPKFNRGGLSGTTFGQRSSAKTTSGTSKQKAPSSISVSSRSYSLKNKKNYKYTAGTEISRGQTADYTALRRTNSTRGARYSSGIDSSFMTNAAVRMGMIQGAYGMQQGGMSTGMAILNGVSMIGQTLFGGVQQTRSAALDAGINSLGGGKLGIADITNNTELSSAALAMTAATDYQSLSTAINSANGVLEQFEKKGPALKSAAQDATRNLSSLEGGVTTAENAKTTANKGVTDAKGDLTTAKSSRDNAKTAFDSAVAQYDETTQAYAQAKLKKSTASAANEQAQANLTTCKTANTDAQAALSNAEATLESTPKEIDGPNGQKIPNPARAQAENAVKMAKSKADAAEKALQQAEEKATATAQALDDANTALEAAEAKVDKAEKNKVDTDDKVNRAITVCEKAEKQVGVSEQAVRDAEIKAAEMSTQYDIAKDNYDTAKEAITAYKDHEQNAAALKNTIKDQEGRLSKMAKQDEKEYKDLKKKGDKRTETDNNRMETLGRSNDAAYAREVLAHGKGKDTTTETIGKEKVTIGTNPTTGHKVYMKEDGTTMNETEYQQLKSNPSGNS